MEDAVMAAMPLVAVTSCMLHDALSQLPRTEHLKICIEEASQASRPQPCMPARLGPVGQSIRLAICNNLQ